MPIVLKFGSLNLLERSGPVQACNGIALPFIVDTDVACASVALPRAGSPLCDVTICHNYCYILHCTHSIKRVPGRVIHNYCYILHCTHSIKKVPGRVIHNWSPVTGVVDNTFVMFDTCCMFGLLSSSHHPTRVSIV